MIGLGGCDASSQTCRTVEQWERTHGQQFKARFLKASAPSSIDEIEKCLRKDRSAALAQLPRVTVTMPSTSRGGKYLWRRCSRHSEPRP
jgi:hypothetical protein